MSTLRPQRSIAIADADYGSADHARRYRSTAGTQQAIDPALRARCLAADSAEAEPS